MRIAVIGEGGHSKVIKDIILSNNENEIIGYLDDKYKNEFQVNGTYYGPINFIRKLLQKYLDVRLIVAIGDNRIRKQVVEKLDLQNTLYVSLIHHTAIVSSSAEIGYGTVVMPKAVINADSKIGNFSIINTSSVVEHDNIVGNYVHVSPNATLTGSVNVEDGTLIGASATVIPNIKVGSWSIIGAGATVINSIPAHTTAVGTPAKLITKKLEV